MSIMLEHWSSQKPFLLSSHREAGTTQSRQFGLERRFRSEKLGCSRLRLPSNWVTCLWKGWPDQLLSIWERRWWDGDWFGSHLSSRESIGICHTGQIGSLCFVFVPKSGTRHSSVLCVLWQYFCMSQNIGEDTFDRDNVHQARKLHFNSYNFNSIINCHQYLEWLFVFCCWFDQKVRLSC